MKQFDREMTEYIFETLGDLYFISYKDLICMSKKVYVNEFI